jgi:hypothetical protein
VEFLKFGYKIPIIPPPFKDFTISKMPCVIRSNQSKKNNLIKIDCQVKKDKIPL